MQILFLSIGDSAVDISQTQYVEETIDKTGYKSAYM